MTISVTHNDEEHDDELDRANPEGLAARTRME